MSVNTARTLYSIFSNPAWKLVLVAGFLAFIACFIIKGKKRAIPIVICVLSLCIYLVTAGISGSADHMISQQAGQEPIKISNMDAQVTEYTAPVDTEPVLTEEMVTATINAPVKRLKHLSVRVKIMTLLRIQRNIKMLLKRLKTIKKLQETIIFQKKSVKC